MLTVRAEPTWWTEPIVHQPSSPQQGGARCRAHSRATPVVFLHWRQVRRWAAFDPEIEIYRERFLVAGRGLLYRPAAPRGDRFTVEDAAPAAVNLHFRAATAKSSIKCRFRIKILRKAGPFLPILGYCFAYGNAQARRPRNTEEAAAGRRSRHPLDPAQLVAMCRFWNEFPWAYGAEWPPSTPRWQSPPRHRWYDNGYGDRSCDATGPSSRMTRETPPHSSSAPAPGRAHRL